MLSENFEYDENLIDQLVLIFKGEVQDNSGDWAYEHIANWLKIQNHLPVQLTKEDVKHYLSLAYWIEPEDIKQEIYLFAISKQISLSNVRFQQGFLSMLMVVIRDWLTWKEKVFIRLFNNHLVSGEEEFIDPPEEIFTFLHPNSLFQTLPLFNIESYLLYLRSIGKGNDEISEKIITGDTYSFKEKHAHDLNVILQKLRKKHNRILGHKIHGITTHQSKNTARFS